MRTLIVGADSGIGNALLQAIPDSIGTSRREDTSMVRLNVLDSSTYPTFTDKLDTIYYCIGVSGKTNTPEDILSTNAIKSIECLRHLATYVNDGGTIRVMSSITGSMWFGVSAHMSLIDTSYRMSKAALNIGVIKLHHEFSDIKWQLLHPGLVRTKMTEGMPVGDPKYTFITPEESAQKILQTPVDKRLSFINVVSGHDIPW